MYKVHDIVYILSRKKIVIKDTYSHLIFYIMLVMCNNKYAFLY